MDNYSHTAHVTFILQNSNWKPWIVAFTSVHPPFETITLAANPNKISFLHRDIAYNNTVNGFHVPDNVKFGTYVDISEMDATIRSVFHKNLKFSDWDVVGAVDKRTYDYLKNIIPTVLIPTNSHSEDITLGVAYRKFQSDEKWRQHR